MQLPTDRKTLDQWRRALPACDIYITLHKDSSPVLGISPKVMFLSLFA